MASKKQINDIESSIIVIDERVEKLEEQIFMMKQMINMQNTLIDNLQMMVKMMNNNHPNVVALSMTGGASDYNVNIQDTKIEQQLEQIDTNDNTPSSLQGGKELTPSIVKNNKLKERFLRVL
jgi:uncharacterized protein involved in tolerance to divalent cations